MQKKLYLSCLCIQKGHESKLVLILDYFITVHSPMLQGEKKHTENDYK